MLMLKSFMDVVLVLILLLYVVRCEVSLKVFLSPPMVTLECLIVNFVEKTSTIMMCPNDQMCFQNCKRLCNDDCITNVIKCTEDNHQNKITYTYTFDSTHIRNQGEWTCHFADQQSSTVIFLNKTNLQSTIPSMKKTNYLMTTRNFVKLSSFINLTSNRSVSKPRKKGRIIANENYIIIILVLFGISLSLNILLIFRGVLHKLYSKKSKIPNCIQKLCIKLFCIENNSMMKKSTKNHFSYENNKILPRQISSNIYECSASSQLHPAILLDNYAFIGTPSNQRMFPTNMYTRSQSFPAKSVEPRLNGIILPNKSIVNTNVSSQFNELISKSESVGPLIYDDVAEPSLTYMPLSFFNQGSSYCRPSQYISINPSFHQNCPIGAISMNNLAVTSCRLPESSFDCERTNEDTILKDAINSRVELSKEMINQADTLLKRADTLLNDNEHQNTFDI